MCKVTPVILHGVVSPEVCRFLSEEELAKRVRLVRMLERTRFTSTPAEQPL